MDPATIAMLVAQLGPAAMQYFTGRKQGKQADALAPKSDPIMPIPESAQAALSNAERNAQSRYLPGQTNLQTSLNQGTANTTSDVLRTSRSPMDALAALTAIHAVNQKGQNEIGYQSAQDFNRRQADLRGQQGVMAGWQNKKWENDVLDKFLRDSAASSALKNASMRNKYEAGKAAFGAIGSAIGSAGGGASGAPKMGGAPSGESPQPMGSINPSALPTSGATPNLSTASPVMLQELGITPEQLASLTKMLGFI